MDTTDSISRIGLHGLALLGAVGLGGLAFAGLLVFGIGAIVRWALPPDEGSGPIG